MKNHKRLPSADLRSYVKESAQAALSVDCLATVVCDTPESHGEFEWQELPEPEPSVSLFCMPWDDPLQHDYLCSLPPLTPELFHTFIVQRDSDDGDHKQRSEGWHRARAFCITASQFGSAVGHNKYQSRPALYRHKLHPHLNPLSSPYAQWGVEHEKHAEEAFSVFLQRKGMFTIDHPNLFRHKDAPWVACSPDGVLYRRENERDVVELIEYKAPAYYRNKVGHPYMKDPYNIPRSYLDQIQGTMWLMRNYDVVRGGRTVERCWFVVWQPHALYVTHIPYLEEYAETLMKSVKDFYTMEFIPGCIEEVTKVQKSKVSN
jgi:putative phage-type endonuclease